MARIVILSDTHGKHRQVIVPDGDFFIHAGDITRHGEIDTVVDFDRFLAGLPHRHKIVIAGNHDLCFERDSARCRELLAHAHYLEDEELVLEGLRFYGSPWQPRFYDWAFNLDRGAPLCEKWDRIPPGTDVLITHGPPLGHGDRVRRGERVGCQDLLEAVRRIRPRLHVFGHIHEGYGVTHEGPTRFVNACICTASYHPTNLAIAVDL